MLDRVTDFFLGLNAGQWLKIRLGPSSPFRVPVYAARTLNAKGQSRVTPSLRGENLRAACGLRQDGKGVKLRPNVSRSPKCPPPGVDKWFANGGGNYFSPAFSVARPALPRVPFSTLLYGEKGY